MEIIQIIFAFNIIERNQKAHIPLLPKDEERMALLQEIQVTGTDVTMPTNRHTRYHIRGDVWSTVTLSLSSILIG